MVNLVILCHHQFTISRNSLHLSATSPLAILYARDDLRSE